MNSQSPSIPTRRQSPPSADWQPTTITDLPLWQSPILSAIDGLAHAFTAAELNLSTTSGPNAKQAAETRRRICAVLTLNPDRLTLGKQVHGVRVAHVSDPLTLARAPRVLPDTDGLVTTQPGVPLLALSADCPLIALIDAQARAIGIAHSGWRGTVANMPGELVRAMIAHCGAHADRAIVVVTPCAGGEAYEIRDDVSSAVAQAVGDPEPYIRRYDDRMYLDLPALIAARLVAAGVPPERVHLPAQCTIRDERFHSYRRNGPNTGQAGLIIGWR